jgi:dihydrofolate reductase
VVFSIEDEGDFINDLNINLQMKKIILDLAVTLDGFIEGPNGEIDWCIMNGDEGSDFVDFVAGIDTIFYGRVSYEMWGNYQPGEQASQELKEIYESITGKTKYVFSTTKTNDNSNAIFINANIKERVNEIKQQPGKDIWLYGGGKLITTFINLDLIDVYRLAVHPVILGSGKPLFKNIKERVNLKLIDSKASKSGIVLLSYSVNR